jgi:2-polyprenyl-6-hydroxyphenyl methylase/3-demethylubiquinone-9 3-methyltransferase
MNGRSGEGLARLLVDIVKQQPNVKSICDLGCGNGYLAGLLGQEGYHVLGVDASTSYLAVARQHYASPNVTFEHAVFGVDAVERVGRVGPFDLVVTSDVIEHLYRPSDLIAVAGAVLRPGGLLVAGTPYHGYLKNLAIAVLDRWDSHHGVHWDGGHIKFFSVHTLRQLVQQAGFSEATFRFYGRMPWLWKNMIVIARKAG